MNLLCVLAQLSRNKCPLALRALLGHGLFLLLVHKYLKLEVMWHGDVPSEAEAPPEPQDTLNAAEAGEPVMVGDDSIPRSPPYSRQLRPG